MKIVLLGAPASGKGTQVGLLSNHFNLTHISTGDIFRDILKTNNDLSKEVEQYLLNGLLVPDDLTFSLVKQKLSKQDTLNNFLLDGFPRNINQAELLKTFTDIDYAIYIDLDFETLVSRCLNRKVCPSCKKIFIKTEHNSENCDVCGEKLIMRADDNREIKLKQYEEFKKETYPLVSYYETLGKLIIVNGNDTKENIFKFIKSKIENND